MISISYEFFRNHGFSCHDELNREDPLLKTRE